MKQNSKSEFRSSSIWKKWRKHIANKQKNIDPITKSKLYAGFSCHHLDLHESNYKNLIEENFVCLNKQTHQTIHWLYTYYKKFGQEFINRIVYYLDKMIELNS